jgi:hypothetical protein
MSVVGKSGPQGLDARHISFTVGLPQNECQQLKFQAEDLNLEFGAVPH